MENAKENAQICPGCQSPLPAGAAEGLCPACLLRRGLELNTVAQTTEATAGGIWTQMPPPLPPRSTPQWSPLSQAELAALFPEFDRIELIGRGGMGAVYKARQKNLDRLIALKILPPEIGSEASFAERFAREAQAMARLNHPHIVTIHDFGRRGEMFFFVMEYVDGLNLGQLLNEGKLAARVALAIVPQICEALQYAHDRAIVHRDIKPENILLSKSGDVKIADFGLAKLMGLKAVEGQASGDAKHVERVMGTPQYMAPEQADRPADVDHRADIYALGVVFYQMLTGELPGRALEPPSRKVTIDVRLDEVVLKALEREPGRRYQQASEIGTAVKTIVSTGVSQTTSTGAATASADTRINNMSEITNQTKPAKSKVGPIIAAVVMICLFLVVLAGVSIWVVAQMLDRTPAPMIVPKSDTDGVSGSTSGAESVTPTTPQMAPTVALHGHVLTTDGKPVSGATVLVAKEGQTDIRIRNGRLEEGNPPKTLSRADGGYTLPAQRGRFVVEVLSDAGYGEADQDALAANGDIQLTPWGRIQGRVMTGTKPGAGVRLRGYSSASEKSTGAIQVSIANFATADANGNFTMERVIPGDVTIEGDPDKIPLNPGETATVKIGGVGRPVVGKLVFPPGVNPSDYDIGLRLWGGPDGRTRLFNQMELDRKQNFRIEDVPTGEYTFSVVLDSLDRKDRKQGGRVDFTMPAVPGGVSDEPLLLPDLQIQK